jgi:hypothetical protein
MFIYKVCHDLCKAAGLSYYSINHNKNSRYYFDTESGGLDDIGTWRARTGCFAPLRYYFMVPEELNARIILHLRDPRDVLVSLYYSEAFSHSVIKGVFDLGRKERNEIVEKGIDAFVLTRAVEFNNKYAEYRCLLGRPDVVFVKYEDLVCNLSAWLGAVAKNFDIVDIKCIEKICDKYRQEFIVRRENIYAHKRKIMPGDYLEKLKPETIAQLNSVLADNLVAYDYQF